MTKSHILQEIKDYAFITVGVILYAIGITVFMLPYNLTTGGVAGIGAIIYYSTGIEIQTTYILMNAVLIAIAIKVLGFRFCIKTIYGVGGLSFFMWLFQRLIEIPNPDVPGAMMLPQMIGDESFMACVLGAILAGLGLTLCFENNGSTGGTDIIAAIVNKHKDVSLGTVIMGCDIVIISSCYFVFHDWFRVIYGFVMLFICSMTLDYCIRRRHQSVQFMIFSRNYQRIAEAIVNSHHGVTILDGEGWYTKSERRVIVCIVRKRQANDILRMVKQIDPFAFLSMTEAHSVFGEAFDPMKVRDVKGQNALQKAIVVYASDDRDMVNKVQALLGNTHDVRTLSDIGCNLSMPINAIMNTGNAKEKATHVKQFYGFDCFALESDASTFTLVQGTYENFENDIHEHIPYDELIKKLTIKNNGKKKA